MSMLLACMHVCTCVLPTPPFLSREVITLGLTMQAKLSWMDCFPCTNSFIFCLFFFFFFSVSDPWLIIPELGTVYITFHIRIKLGASLTLLSGFISSTAKV